MAGPVTTSKKLGVRAGSQVVLLGAPERWCARFEAEVRDTATVSRQLAPARVDRAPVDCVLVFLDRLSDLEACIGRVSSRLHPDGQVWVAWRSNRSVDVTEEMVRRVGLAAGMHDTRIRKVDKVWTAMRLVIDRQNRDALSYRLERASSGPGSALATARARRRS